MFSYFGSKSKLARYYPKPCYDCIVEPFCGAAHYALLYYYKQVHINDVNPNVIEIWKWIQQASSKDILSIPEPQYAQRISEIKGLERPVELLLRLLCSKSSASFNRDFFTKYSGVDRKRHRKSGPPKPDKSTVQQFKQKALKYVGKLSHWKITCMDYKDLPNIEATWFIDPPYQKLKRSRYEFNNRMIDYQHLAEWCLSRQGEIIVCEQSNATWLPFKPLRKVYSLANNKYQEVVYIRRGRKVGLERLLEDL